MIGGFFVFPCPAARGLPDRNEMKTDESNRQKKKSERCRSFRRFRPALRMIMKQIRTAHASIKAISGSISAESDTKWALPTPIRQRWPLFYLAWPHSQTDCFGESLPPGMRLINATATF